MLERKFRTFYIGALAALGFALVGTSFIPHARADAWDKMTIVTVNEPIIAGHKVLDPGTYVWKLMDSPSDRHVVQIFDKDQKHLEETILAVPNYRVKANGKQFTFWETPAGVPKAVHAWFYPGDNYGQEFPYPKKMVAELASTRPVPIPNNYREPEPPPAPKAEPQPVAQPAPPPVALPAPEPAPQTVTPSPQSAPVAQPASLPHTASFNPLIGLLGLMALSLSGLLTLVTRRS